MGGYSRAPANCTAPARSRADRHHGSCHGAATGRGRWHTPDPALCGPDALKSALRMQGLAISSVFSAS
ncbi:hypothetical protein [Streptomyces sp. NPDC056255]|uniref:hypothetical protein n=1 Tax=Streptomyces sp. NPDC056255 TaxID=3345764 RepID=UPI0035DC7E3F